MPHTLWLQIFVPMFLTVFLSYSIYILNIRELAYNHSAIYHCDIFRFFNTCTRGYSHKQACLFLCWFWAFFRNTSVMHCTSLHNNSFKPQSSVQIQTCTTVPVWRSPPPSPPFSDAHLFISVLTFSYKCSYTITDNSTINYDNCLSHVRIKEWDYQTQDQGPNVAGGLSPSLRISQSCFYFPDLSPAHTDSEPLFFSECFG